MDKSKFIVNLARDAPGLAGVAEVPLTAADLKCFPRGSAIAMALCKAFGGICDVTPSLCSTGIILTLVPRDTDTPAMVHAKALSLVDECCRASEAIRANASNPATAQPLCSITTEATIAVLKANAGYAAPHKVVCYTYGGISRQLPALEPADLTDIESTEPKRKHVDLKVIGLYRDIAASRAGMIFEGNLYVATNGQWDRYRHVLDVPHFVSGDIESRAAGEWVLNDDAVLTGELVLPQFSADAICPKLTPKASPHAKRVGI